MSSHNSSPTLSPTSTPSDSPHSFVRALSPTTTVVEPSFIVLPDLIAHCPFSPTFHADGKAVSADSLEWILSHSPHFSQKKVASMHGLQAAELAAYCFNDCPSNHLRVVSDYLYYLFVLDDISDGYLARDAEAFGHCVMNAFEWPDDYRPICGQQGDIQIQENNAAKLTRDFWSRCIRVCAPAVQQRFKSHMNMFFEAVHQQAVHRATGVVPDLGTYIELRRETSACRPIFDLVEYSLDLELPDAVVEHPVIRALNDGANDLVTWSNDLYSYNVEQARGDTHNMICVFMMNDGLSLQQAVDRLGEMCKQTIDTFVENLSRVPSWGDDIDRDVKLYVGGMREWIVGSLYWSFETKRYFGDNGEEVKATGVVELLPQESTKT